MPHLMIDLETLSTAPTAVITQLGWALFEPDGPEGVLSSGCIHLEVPPQVAKGMTMDWATIEWWLQQAQDARNLLTSKDRVIPTVALQAFEAAAFKEGTIVDAVWSHGATFDLVILANLYAKAGRPIPWNYKLHRDTRTLFWLAPNVKWPDNPVKHSAEHDAIAQAITVQRAVNYIQHKLGVA